MQRPWFWYKYMIFHSLQKYIRGVIIYEWQEDADLIFKIFQILNTRQINIEAI